MASSTRKKSEIWLIGQPLSSLTCSKFPTTGQILRRFFFHLEDRLEGQKKRRECARLTVEEAFTHWEKSGVPLQQTKDATDTLLTLHNEWTNMKKSKSRKGDAYEKVRDSFKANLESTYDLAHVDAVQIMEKKIETCKNEKEKAAMIEDLNFYKLQMESRVGSMLKKDMDVVKKFKKQQRIQEGKEKMKRKYEDDQASTSETFQRVSWDTVKNEELSGEIEERETDDAQEFDIHEHQKRKKKIDVLIPSLVSSLDRNNQTDRRATRTIKETAKALGHDPSSINLSRSTLRRKRQANREEVQTNFTQYFCPKGPVVVHWDGKLLPNEDGEKVDRLPVVVKDLETGEEQLLGIIALKQGTGKAQADAIKEVASTRAVVDKVCGMAFDTTSSNTGINIGACVLLEQSLERNLIRLACRHHVLELPVKAGFDSIMEASTSPITPLFDRFAKFWKDADQANYMSAVQLQVLRRIRNADEIIMFCNEQLMREKKPRDDYEHLLRYIVTFLGGIPPGGVRFYKPGPVNKTRFMGNGLYCLLIAMFSQQFDLSPAEKTAVIEVSLFIAMAYIKPWILANVATAAPRLDLQLLQTFAHEFKRLRKDDARKTLWQTAGYKFLGHLWYLSPELVSLSLFDPVVSIPEKQNIVEAIRNNPLDDDTIYKGVVNKLGSSVQRLRLCDFANRGSLRFFSKLQVEPEFLDVHPSEWEKCDSYLRLKTYVANLPTTNDAAERGVALAKEFNNKLTKNEYQKQGLYIVVSNDRKLQKQK